MIMQFYTQCEQQSQRLCKITNKAFQKGVLHTEYRGLISVTGRAHKMELRVVQGKMHNI
jgi:hypothetical protein